MTSSSPNLPPDGDRPWWAKWVRCVVIGGGVLGFIGVAGTVAARFFVYRQLGPMVETILGETISRPVELGPIIGFSLSGIQIDGAAIPPTADDDDYAQVPKVEVGFNPVQVLTNVVRDRTLPITLTFIDPELYIQEDSDRRWIELQLKESTGNSDSLTLGLETIKATNATLIIAPFPQANDLSSNLDTTPVATPVVLQDIDAIAHLRDNNRFLKADVSGRAEGGGEFDLMADADLKQFQVKANLLSHEIAVAPFNDLLNRLAPLPATLQSGRLNTHLTIEYNSDDGLPMVTGTAQVTNASTTITGIPQPISNVNSLLRFSGQTVAIEETSLAYGPVTVTASGTVDLEDGYDIAARLPTTSLTTLQEAAEVDLPVEVGGTVAATVAITGPLAQPILAGTLQNRDSLLVDQLVAETLSAKFRVTPTQATLTQLILVPRVGGTIEANGRVVFDESMAMQWNAAVRDLPTDAIATLYGVSIPAPIELGTLNSTLTATGRLSEIDQIEAIAQWRLPNGTYPTQGTIRYQNQVLQVQDTVVNAALTSGSPGTLTASADVFLAQQRWDAQLEADGFDVGGLVPYVQGRLNSRLDVSGSLAELTPEAVEIQGVATLKNAQVALNGAPLLEPGSWDTAFRWEGNGLRINRFTAPGVRADGFVTTNLQGLSAGEVGEIDTLVTALDVNVVVDPYSLNRLQALVPASFQSSLNQQVTPYFQDPLYPQGEVAFQGRLTGTLTQPQIAGNVDLTHFSVASFAFDPLLSGPINISLGQGGQVDLEGDGDRIYARLDERYLPTDFEVRQGTFNAYGSTESSNRLTASIENFDLSELGIRPWSRPDLDSIGGVVNLNLSANLTDLSNPSVDGKVAISNPTLGDIQAEVFTGDLSYRNGTAALNQGFFCIGLASPDLNDRKTDAVLAPAIFEMTSNTPAHEFDDQFDSDIGDELDDKWGSELDSEASNDRETRRDHEAHNRSDRCRNRSQFEVAAAFNVRESALESSVIAFDEVHVQDILTTLKWFTIDDAIQWLELDSSISPLNLSRAAEIDTLESVQLPDAPLLTADEPIIDQVDYFFQWLSQWQPRQGNQPRELLPALQTLTGDLSGTVHLTSSRANGLGVGFDLSGNELLWGHYQHPASFSTRGQLTPNHLFFDRPLTVSVGDANIILEGQVGLNQPGASTLMVSDVSLDFLNEILPILAPQFASLTIDGTFHTDMVFAGTVSNPTINGTLVVDQPRLRKYLSDEDVQTTAQSLSEESLTLRTVTSFRLPTSQDAPEAKGSEGTAIVADVAIERIETAFSYDRAQFNLNSTMRVQDEAQLLINANIPYALEFMDVQPQATDLISAQVETQNIAVKTARNVAQLFVPQVETFPIEMDGLIQMETAISGTRQNPKMTGVVLVDQARINRQALEQVAIQFGYNQSNDARLTFDSTMALRDDERLDIEGYIPYGFSFMNVKPSENLRVSVNAKDEGIKLINLFTQGYAIWESGTGLVDLVIDGMLSEGKFSTPDITGILSLNEGRLSSPYLVQPITDIAGRIDFVSDRLVMTEPLQARLGNGTVIMQGQLPLLSDLPQQDEIAVNGGADAEEAIASSETNLETISSGPSVEPEINEINIAVNTLPLQLRDLVSARVHGDVSIRRSAIAPILSGYLDVTKGRVDVAGILAGGAISNANDSRDRDRGAGLATNEVRDKGAYRTIHRDPRSKNHSLNSIETRQFNLDGLNINGRINETATDSILNQVTFDALTLDLEKLQIARQPFFDLEAAGDLRIHGTLADLRGSGNIRLTSGWINLFATQFRLDRDQDHVAQFRRNRALIDPRLDITMRSIVQEVERSPVPPSSPFASAEVIDQSSIPTFGGLQSVVITARVDGSARHLLDHLTDSNSASPNPLTFSSDPRRSERQIVALLGGEILNALESGNTGLAIASYVGSGFLAGVGNQIADSIGLSEFSIFPTTDPSGESRLPITIGVEAGVDIIPRRLSFSILEVLDGNANPQFGLRYRLSDHWQLRGGSDLSGDNRAMIEFRTDF